MHEIVEGVVIQQQYGISRNFCCHLNNGTEDKKYTDQRPITRLKVECLFQSSRCPLLNT